MSKLTDTQLMMLSKASQRDDRAVECPHQLKGGALKAVVSKLLDGGLLNEIAAKRGMPAWRQDDDGSFALVITRAGLKAIAADSEESPADQLRGSGAETEASRARPKGRGTRESGSVPRSSPRGHAAKPAEFRAGSKQALILSMLQKRGGASIADLVSATGWLPHTTRAALTGLRKRGYGLERSRSEEGKPSVYRVVPQSAQVA